mgnify:CR=1 FL=1
MSNKKYSISRLFLRLYDFRKTHLNVNKGEKLCLITLKKEQLR